MFIILLRLRFIRLSILKAVLSATCANRNDGQTKYAMTDVDDFNHNVVKMVERTNIMSGEKFMERSDTPYYCSPSSESYWCN